MEDKRTTLSRLKTVFVKKAPRRFVCEVASVLHGVVVPYKNMKNMEKYRK